ncbi:MAG TPA: prepilin peptidase [Candidatus Paceibacterota bacterium]|nr:prepilin peptidase [Candidatus Paceibacterota bacterium]
MVLLLTAIFFVLGLIIGSFLNVVICRINTARTMGGRSACMTCERRLSWYELIPLFSFAALRGRCKSCKTKISIQYPLVEFTTGLIFASLFLKYQDIFFTDMLAFFNIYTYYAIIFSILIVSATYDLKHKIIPDVLSLIFGLLAFLGLFLFTSLGFYPHIPSILEFLSGFLIALPFTLLWLVSGGRWMGFGDAKLALGIGWLQPLSSAFSGLAIAFWSGAIVGIFLVIWDKRRRIRNRGMKSEIPFAPFLALGAILAFIFGLNFFGI